MCPAENRPQRALVLDADSSVGVETVQSLGRRGVIVDAASLQEDCLAFHSRFTRQMFKQAAYDGAGAEFAGWIEELDAASRYQLIVPSTEVSLLSMMSLDENSALRRKAVMPCNKSLEIALDKQRTWNAASELGIGVPHTRIYHSLSEVCEEPAYPLVLKAARSKVVVDGQVQHFAPAVINSRQDWLTVLENWLPYVAVQEQTYFPGKGVGIELLFDRGRKIWHFAHERLHEYPLTGGCSTYRRSIVPDVRMLAAAERLMTALNWHGAAMVEFKLAANGEFCLLEINPRLWGSLALAIDAGVDFPWALMLLATGQTPPSQPHYKVPYYTRRFDLDVAWLRNNFLADHHNPCLLTRSRAVSLLEYFRLLTGRESWDHFDIRDLGTTYRILRDTAAQFVNVLVQLPKKRLLEARLRHGHRRLTRAALRPKRLLFVCYGNICRSPVAEHLAKARLPGVEVESAGFYPVQGRPSPQKIVRTCGQLGVDLSGFRSRQISPQSIAAADLILVMDIDNYAEIAARYPQARRRMTALGLFCHTPTASISDPCYLSESDTSQVVKTIAQAIEGLHQWLAGKTSSGQTGMSQRPSISNSKFEGDASAPTFTRPIS